jgi:hypothetical protein
VRILTRKLFCGSGVRRDVAAGHGCDANWRFNERPDPQAGIVANLLAGFFKRMLFGANAFRGRRLSGMMNG